MGVVFVAAHWCAIVSRLLNGLFFVLHDCPLKNNIWFCAVGRLLLHKRSFVVIK